MWEGSESCLLKSSVTTPRLTSIHNWLLVVVVQVSWGGSLSSRSVPDDDDDVFRVMSVPRRLFGQSLSSLEAMGGGERISHMKNQSYKQTTQLKHGQRT